MVVIGRCAVANILAVGFVLPAAAKYDGPDPTSAERERAHDANECPRRPRLQPDADGARWG